MENQAEMKNSMTFKFWLLLVAATFLGMTTGCDKKSSSSSNRTTNPFVCNAQTMTAEQYQACINNPTNTVYGTSNLYRAKLNITDKNRYEDYLESQNICGNGIAIAQNDCQWWDDAVGVEVQFAQLTAPYNARVFIDSIANGWPFNYQDTDGTFAGKPALMNTQGQFVLAFNNTALSMERNFLRLLVKTTTFAANTAIEVELQVNGNTVAQGSLQPVQTNCQPPYYCN